MKKLFYRISIFVLLISACACFMFPASEDKKVYATSSTDCYYMIKDDGVYQSNQIVGSILGGGEFVVGAENIELIATANKNYQLVGWQITYKNQSNRTEFINTSGLDVNYIKNIKLTPHGVEPENGVDATLSFTYSNGIYTGGSFKLSYVFEDLKIVPVFDCAYYNINISSLVEVSSLENSKTVGSNTLYYDQEIAGASVTTYKNAYFKIDGEYFYYGDVYFDGTTYYTEKTTLESTPTTYKVDYKKGAFKFGEKVEIKYNINIDSNDILNSINIDLIGVGVVAAENSTTLASYVEDMQTNYYKTSKDSFLRTKNYELKFNILESRDYKNTVNLTYHNLYVVNLNITVDGSSIAAEHEKLEEIFGETTVTQNDIQSNLLINNFYSITNENNTQFLVKNSQDNAFKDFKINAAKQIVKLINGATYLYYDFVSLNGQAGNNASYASISENAEIAIAYSTLEYEIEFKLAEYFITSELNATLIEMEGDCLSSISLKRGDQKTWDASDVEDLVNHGYNFVGFATSYGYIEEISSSFTYTVNTEKPLGITVLLCYQKIAYEVVLANYNSIDIAGVHALESITFVKTGAEEKTKTLSSSDLESKFEENVGYKPYDLGLKIKLGDKLSISYVKINGFVILGFNFDELSEEYVDFTNFELTSEVVASNNFDDRIVIYIHEVFDDFSITYYIEPTHDPNVDTKVIMADISVSQTTGVVTKYTQGDVEICAENNNLTAKVAKIVVSGLKLDDIIVLESISVDEAYMFNWFTVDGTSTLDFESVDAEGGKTYYNHEEIVKKSRKIKVVYSMQKTKLFVSFGEDFGSIADFVNDISFSVYQNGIEIPVDESVSNSFSVEMGEIYFEIEAIGFGYKFIGYSLNNAELEEIAGRKFDCTLTSKLNYLNLNFERIKYNFSFRQSGAGFDEEYIDFGGKDYIQLNIDSRSIEITKPTGYYVGFVKFGSEKVVHSTSLHELNSYGNNANISIYQFGIQREMFKEIIDIYGTEDQGVISVDVYLEYLVFTYDVSVEYGLTQPKGNGLDKLVQYPSLNISYIFNGVTTTKTTHIDNNVATFTQIPYGAVATINLVGQVQNGLAVSGWRFANGDIISDADYEHSSSHIKIGEVKNNLRLQYKFSYVAYTIELDYNSTQGAPTASLNNIGININSIQVTLFDRIEINAEAIRNNGYKFKSFSYNVPKYTEYVYSAESWETDCLNLYVNKGGLYLKNSSIEYNSQEQYYVYEEETVVYSETSRFVIGDFRASNYVLSNQKVIITIEYELLSFTLSHNTKEATGKNYGTLYSNGYGIGKDGVTIGSDNASVKILIDPTNYLIITISTYQVDQFVVIDKLTAVNFYDLIKIDISINQAAKNHDEKIYDLTKGLKLTKLTISGQNAGFEDLQNGVYSVTFTVGQYIEFIAGEEVEIAYTVAVTKKTVSVTTEINSETFFKEIQFGLNAYKYEFASNSQTATGTKELKHDFQFLTVLDVTFQFLNESDYNGHFKVIGVNIYCNNTYISPNQYESYNITILDDYTVVARISYDLKVVYKISPEITFKGGTAFKKTFVCDNSGKGIAQTLSVGSTEAYDIQLAEIIKDCLVVKYINPNKQDEILTSVTNCGNYNVILTFKESGEYDWLSQIVIEGTVTFEIVPKSLYVSYNEEEVSKNVKQKVYDGTSDWDPKTIYSLLEFTDGEGINIKYGSSADNNLRFEDGVLAYVTLNGKDDPIADANEESKYNLYIYNIMFKDNTFNNNFVLINSDLIIPQIVQIKKKELLLIGVTRDVVKDKIYDGTNVAYWVSTDNIELKNKYAKDDVSIDKEKLNLVYTDAEIGYNKTVKLDTSDILVGTKAKNYYVKNITITGISIYPSSLSVNVFGVGEVSVHNIRGLTEDDKIDLIPIGATLVVEAIRAEDATYASIYADIEKHLKGRTEFAIGYQIYMLVNGSKVPVNNNLHLSIPSYDNVVGIYYLTGTKTGEISADHNDNVFLIDLQQIEFDVDKIFITQKTILLKPWQIALIVITAVAVTAAVVLTFVIIRKRKFREYSEQEKI